MTASAPLGVLNVEVVGVPDDTYYEAVCGLVEAAREVVFASVFIVDINAHGDPDARIIALLHRLRDAAWRGVEVRLLIGSSHKNIAIGEACHIAGAYARSLGIPCRILASAERRGSHSKFVLNESSILSGSHNWSLGAVSGQFQDSVRIDSPALAAYMRRAFELQWQRSLDEA